MPARAALNILFSCILVSMIAVTTWASLHQAVQHWGGATTGPDRYWTVATLMDAYCGFLTFYAWVYYKERHWLPRILWFAAIMVLGNIAMSTYMLRQLMRLGRDQDLSFVLTGRNG